jgi:hypothetical protein
MPRVQPRRQASRQPAMILASQRRTDRAWVRPGGMPPVRRLSFDRLRRQDRVLLRHPERGRCQHQDRRREDDMYQAKHLRASNTSGLAVHRSDDWSLHGDADAGATPISTAIVHSLDAHTRPVCRCA